MASNDTTTNIEPLSDCNKVDSKGRPKSTKKPGKLKRAPHTKARSGCWTCKKRRVKCDERQPYCLRCEKFGVVCDGYPSNRKQPVVGSSKQVSRITLPRKRVASPEVISLTEVEVKKPRFGNDEEMRYFRLFCEKTSYQLSGFYDPAVWGRIVLQASEAEDSIRHAVISIGALDMTTVMMQNCANKDAREHHLFALKQYSKAIKDMQAILYKHNGLQDVHTALVASILIVCFETYHGNYTQVAKQIRTGIRLIEDQKEKVKQEGNSIRHGIDVDLIMAFDRLEVQSMSHSDPFTLEENIALRNVYTHTAEDLPTSFTDLKECRNYFNYISRRACHFASMAGKLEHASPTDGPGDPETYLYTSPQFAKQGPNHNWRHALVSEMIMFIQLSEAWMKSFMPLYQEAKEAVASPSTPKPLSKNILGPLAMRDFFLCLRLAFRHFPDVEEMAWDRSMPEFIEILENSEIICANRDELVFSFDLQSVWRLDVVAKKCRDSKMRRRAIWLLKERPRRGGIWDSIVAAMVCEWVANVEEEGMLEDGTVPESARARNICVQLNSEERQAKVWCYLPLASSLSTPNPKYEATCKRETYLEWGSSKWNNGFGTRSDSLTQTYVHVSLGSSENHFNVLKASQGHFGNQSLDELAMVLTKSRTGALLHLGSRSPDIISHYSVESGSLDPVSKTNSIAREEKQGIVDEKRVSPNIDKGIESFSRAYSNAQMSWFQPDERRQSDGFEEMAGHGGVRDCMGVYRDT